MDTSRYIIAGFFVIALAGLGWAWWFYEEGSDADNLVTPPPPGSMVQGVSSEGAAVAAQNDLALRLGADQNAIIIRGAVEMDWPDACLGLPDKEAMCAQIITPGYKVTLEAGGKTYVYRTNTSGSVLKMEN